MNFLKAFLVLIALPVATPVFAQKELKIRNNEIGVMTDVTIGDGDVRTNLFGLQYRRFKSDRYRNNSLGIRISAGKGTIMRDDAGGSIYSTGSFDSLKHVTRDHWQHLFFIGLGVDAQRQLYKSVSIYAALNINVGYGKAGIDSSTEYLAYNSYGSYGVGPYSIRTTNSIEVGNAFWMSISPIVGIKLAVGKRIWVGTEFTTFITFDNAPINTKGTRLLNVDLEPGRLNERFYVAYRF